MHKLFTIAVRNLTRFGRRTLLTSSLITLGIVGVLLFIAVSGSFKSIMIGQFTDAMLGHVEVHRRGYVASIDSLPLNLNMQPAIVAKVEGVLNAMPEVEAYSERIKLGAMFSNFTETTSIRINGVDPVKEAATTPLLPGRLVEGARTAALLNRGEVLIPTVLARGMKVKPGDTVVLVATNRDGSVNGKTFVVRGVLESISGPSGKDGYIHIDDARQLLRMSGPEVSEIAIRLKNPALLEQTHARLVQELAKVAGPGPGGQGAAGLAAGSGGGNPATTAGGLEVHTWADLSPFSSIVRMIDLLALFIKVMMVSIVLISVMNVMVMAVYERIREIGTIAAIGTPPGRILSLFLTEGLLLGIGGAALGTAISLGVIYALNVWKVSVRFGMQQSPVVLTPSIRVVDVVVIVAMVVLVALLASLQPAWKASRMDPVKALGHV
jgi:putative ABC transport system permease protein